MLHSSSFYMVQCLETWWITCSWLSKFLFAFIKSETQPSLNFKLNSMISKARSEEVLWDTQFHWLTRHLFLSGELFFSFALQYFICILSLLLGRVPPHDVVNNKLACNIIISEFELQSCYYVYVWINTLGKSMNSLMPPPFMGSIEASLFIKD